MKRTLCARSAVDVSIVKDLEIFVDILLVRDTHDDIEDSENQSDTVIWKYNDKVFVETYGERFAGKCL